MCRIPDGMKWSFSKLEAFHHCGMMFKLIYLDHAEKEGNGFSDYGTFCHKLLEEWAKGQIPDFALAEEYQERYDDEVVNAFPPFPRGMPQKYYDQGLQYFENFDFFGDDYEILTVEEKFEIEIDGYILVGIADLTLRNKKTGGIVVIDHKSKSKNSMKKEFVTSVDEADSTVKTYTFFGSFTRKVEDYLKTWRCWIHEPTAEKMKTTPWMTSEPSK